MWPYLAPRPSVPNLTFIVVMLHSNFFRCAGTRLHLLSLSCLAFVSFPFVSFAGITIPPVAGTQAVDLNDGNNDFVANPGETIDYDIRLTSIPIGPGATNISVEDTVDPNATLVPGSLKVGPVGIDDTYAVNGNIGISVAAVSGVLANDLDPDGGLNPTLTVSATNSTATKGSVTVNADGSFSYTPPAGFVGSDSFEYTVRDAQGLDGLSQGKVTLTVANPVWFIDDSDLTADDATAGTLANPFNSIAAFNTRNNGGLGNAGDGHGVFLYRGLGAPAGAFALRNAQVLLGQGVAISSTTLGFSLAPFSEALPAVSSPPVINGSASAIQLGINNTIRGLNVGNVPSSSFAIVGANFGTLTLSDFNTSGTGGIFNLSNGSLNATTNITSLASTGSNTGMILTNVSGTGLVVASVTSIDQFSGNGMRLMDSRAPIHFGQLDITTLPALVEPTGVGLFASNMGSITSTTGILNVGDAVAVDIDNANLSLVFQSVTADGSNRGIDLDTTVGSFIITGVGTTSGSGGMISNAVNDGIFLNNAAGVSVSNLNMSTIGRSAVYGRNGCSNVTLRNGTFTTIGGTAAAGLHALNFDGVDGDGLASVVGTLQLSGITINGMADTALMVHNETGMLAVTVNESSSFVNNDDVHGQYGINIESNGSAAINLTVDGTSFDQIESSAINFEHDSSGTNQLIVTNSSSTNGGGLNDSGGGGITAIASNSGSFNIVINGNNLTDVSGPGVLIAGAVNSSQTLTARIGASGSGNVITGRHTSPELLEDGIGIQKDSGGDWDIAIAANTISVGGGSASNLFHGIYVRNRDNAASLTMLVVDNTVSDTDAEGFRFYSDDDILGGSDPTTQLTLSNNSFATPSLFLTAAVEFRVNDQAAVCLNMFDNTLLSTDEIIIDVDIGASFGVYQSSSVALSALNGNATITALGTVDYAQPLCPLPVIPTL